jgi:hypothetical protein
MMFHRRHGYNVAGTFSKICDIIDVCFFPAIPTTLLRSLPATYHFRITALAPFCGATWNGECLTRARLGHVRPRMIRESVL